MMCCNNLVFFYYSYDKHPLVDRMPVLANKPAISRTCEGE